MGCDWSPGGYQVIGGSAKTTVPGALVDRLSVKSASGARTFALFGPVRPKNLKTGGPPGIVGGLKTTLALNTVGGGASRARVEVDPVASGVMTISFSVRLCEFSSSGSRAS